MTILLKMELTKYVSSNFFQIYDLQYFPADVKSKVSAPAG